MAGEKERASERIAVTPSQKAKLDAIAEDRFSTHAGVVALLLDEHERAQKGARKR